VKLVTALLILSQVISDELQRLLDLGFDENLW